MLDSTLRRGRQPANLVRNDHLRLMARVARMYHERGMRQAEIAAELHISQPRVSRLLKQAVDVGIVRTVVSLPAGVHTDLEEALEARFGLSEAVVADVSGIEGDSVQALGAAAATYLETTLTGHDRIGISSWSASLLAAIEVMRPSKTRAADVVVQLVGGLGTPRVQVQATRLLERLAMLVGAEAVFMLTPGVMGTAEARESLLSDPTMEHVMTFWQDLTVALVGIGALNPSPMLRESGNTLAEADLRQLQDLDAVGDVCLRYFDHAGRLVRSDFDGRVAGISAELLHRVPRRVGVAGGESKLQAVRGAVLGGWVNVLITDSRTAEMLLQDSATT
ncbi:sugar-binding domain-containing protein [Georgenia sp. M64]|uniref:sugar-binding transcriptional regulator n=1 Tax=Georgenia sp. M64 TaxID=3120520 RepID=UPI0030E133E1